jgi:hypothetical protein
MIAFLSLSACTGITNGKPTDRVPPSLRAARVPAPLVAESVAESGATADAVIRFADRHPPGAQGTRATMSAQVALLHDAPDGRAYLSVAAPRAFVIGAPPAICPARVAAAGGDGLADALDAALTSCFADLRTAEAPTTCGCQVIAADDLLLAPLDAFAYAPGVSGWVESPALGLDLHFAVREGSGPGGARTLAFLTGTEGTDGALGARIVATLGRDGTASMAIDLPDVPAGRRAGDPPLVLRGAHRPEGLRRGRFADRLRLRDSEGRELVALIGYEPVEYATRRAALLGWR